MIYYFLYINTKIKIKVNLKKIKFLIKIFCDTARRDPCTQNSMNYSWNYIDRIPRCLLLFIFIIFIFTKRV